MDPELQCHDPDSSPPYAWHHFQTANHDVCKFEPVPKSITHFYQYFSLFLTDLNRRKILDNFLVHSRNCLDFKQHYRMSFRIKQNCLMENKKKIAKHTLNWEINFDINFASNKNSKLFYQYLNYFHRIDIIPLNFFVAFNRIGSGIWIKTILYRKIIRYSIILFNTIDFTLFGFEKCHKNRIC